MSQVKQGRATGSQPPVLVASGSLTGIVRVQQNSTWSNALTFTEPGNTTILVPNLMNMAVGDTATVQASNLIGQPLTGLTWTSSDSTVVSVSTDNPPVLTAVAAGHATILAGTASVDITVAAGSLPLGTVVWSNPGNGSGVKSIVPAVPSPTGVADVFAFQNDGTVQAIRADGTTAWTADVSQAFSPSFVLPDFSGGLVAEENGNLVRIDGMTGQATTLYTGSASARAEIGAIHTDGTVVALLAGIDGTTGAQKFSVPLPVDPNTALAGAPIIAGDGYIYVPYVFRVGASALYQINLLRIASSGATNDIKVWQWAGGPYDLIPVETGLITNADQGVVLTWVTDFTRSGMAVVTGTSVNVLDGPKLPGGGGVFPDLQQEDGSFIGTAYALDANFEPQPYLVGFDLSGNLLWSLAGSYTPQIATDDGGTIATEDSGAAFTFDQNGSATGQMLLRTEAWTANSYRMGSIEQVLTNVVNRAVSWWPFGGGNSSANYAAVRPVSEDVQQLVAQIARDYTNPPQNANWEFKEGPQCSYFVQQVLNDAKTQAPLSLNTRFKTSFPRIAHYLKLTSTSYPASAGDWAFPHNTMQCWRTVGPVDSVFGHFLPPDVSRPGDIIAESVIRYVDASGHVGIVVGPQQTASADSAAGCVSGSTIPPEVIDITNYGFRPDGTQIFSPTHQVCSELGWKSQAVVKRFVCQ